MQTDPDPDPVTGATYRRLGSAPVARTVHVTDMILVDVDQDGAPVGVEYAVAPDRLSSDDMDELLRAFPALRNRLPEAHRMSAGFRYIPDVSSLTFTGLHRERPGVLVGKPISVSFT